MQTTTDYLEQKKQKQKKQKQKKRKALKLVKLDPSKVSVGWRARTDLGDVDRLASSIAQLGQISPIAVANGTDDGTYNLISGLRRLRACEILGSPVWAVVMEPGRDLDQLDAQLFENWRRKELDVYEVGQGLARRRELYEAIYPESATEPGKKKKRGKGLPERFAVVAARELGVAEPKIWELMSLCKIPREARERIESATTTRERNRLAICELRRIRKEKKLARLEERAQKAQAQVVMPGCEGNVSLHLKDNATFFAEAEPGSFDLILTDPPYDTERKSLISHVSRGDISADFGAWDKLDIGWVLKAAPLLSDGGQALVFCPLEAVGDYRTVFESIGLIYRGAILWHRTNPGTAHRPTYLSATEAIVWATRGHGYVFQPWDNAGAREVHNLIEGPNCSNSERLDHPTQKPEWLIDRLLKRHTHRASRVLDPFAGVGTTLVCAKRLGLSAVGIEQDPDYCGQAVIRIRAT